MSGSPEQVGFSHGLADGQLQCDLCPRHCRLADGQRGFCFGRMRSGDRVTLTTYGRAVGLHLDPIEKKPLFHFYPGTSVLSFGTAGCNLGCRFCQNWRMSRAREDDLGQMELGPEAIAEAAVTAAAPSVAFTYNDPVGFAEYAMDTARACRDRGIRTVAVTAGYVTREARRALFGHIDAANVDLKAFSEDFYRRMCHGKLEPVLDTLRWLKQETSVWLEVTTLLIPGENDSEAELDRACAWLATHLGPETPVHFSAFHPDFKLTDRPATPGTVLVRARRQALGHGLRHVYIGNLRDGSGQATTCAGCGALLIERSGYRLGSYRLGRGGVCLACARPVAGRFT